jgi:hypothetical protein
MNWKSPVSAAIRLAALFLVFSCRTKDAGITVRNPTVADMQKLEAEWGLPPKPAATGTATSVPAAEGGTATVTTSTTTTPAETTPGPTAPAVPPSLR